VRTVVSIPDDVFEAAERLAKRLKVSRSAIYAEAMAEYLARREPQAITDAMNAVCDAMREERDDFVDAAARRILERTGW